MLNIVATSGVIESLRKVIHSRLEVGDHRLGVGERRLGVSERHHSVEVLLQRKYEHRQREKHSRRRVGDGLFMSIGRCLLTFGQYLSTHRRFLGA